MTTPYPVPDRGPVDTALDTYTAQVTQLAATAAEAEAENQALQAEIADLQAKLDAAGPLTETVSFSDFTQLANHSAGMVLPTVVAGKGVDRTVYEMAPGTSTKASMVPVPTATVPNPTNPLVLLVTGGGDSTHVTPGIDLGGFTLQGTDQGHLYNGLMVRYSTGARIHDIEVHAIPGSDNAPPGETFSVNLWHADGARVERVTVTGDGVGASLIGANNLTGLTLLDCKLTGAVYGMGFTGWKTSNISLIGCDLSGNRRALNFEQCGGTITILGCDMRRVGKLPHVTVNSNLGSAKVTIVDPLVDAWPLKVGVSSQPYLGKPQIQRVADVRLIVNGVDQTANRAFLACGDVW